MSPHVSTQHSAISPERERFDFAVFADWVSPSAHVLDLGCGNGRLLKFLAKERTILGYGVEIDDAHVLAALQNGVNVIQIDIEAGLKGFEDHAFDQVILSQSLQALFATETVLREMLRVGKEALVSFPNFAYKTNSDAIAAGKMPVSEDLPYEWYNSPNIRFLTIADFEALCARLGITIKEARFFDEKGASVTKDPNLEGSLAFYRLG